ncbi:sodium/potassium/calcium exchanger 1-like [Cyprinodon tularosa]|uniref:sodium/potassium/calcium exchanger 1-like n=1 Tax=Cyprinodon tularosa TaxID=77115 RepID=UPI0018E24AA0|nr:sodium/potassium/calcium exchanger 1-like [Cyprinodon tularosa]
MGPGGGPLLLSRWGLRLVWLLLLRWRSPPLLRWRSPPLLRWRRPAAAAVEGPAAAAAAGVAAVVSEGRAAAAEEPMVEEPAPGIVEASVMKTVKSVKMIVCVRKDGSTVLSGDGVNGGEAESAGGERDGVQGEQEEVKGDEGYLACGVQGEKGEVEVRGQVERSTENSVELFCGGGVEGERGEAEEVMELEASAPKRKSKRKNVVAAAQASKLASKQASQQAAEKEEESDSSDAESWVSDTSELSLSQSSDKEPLYPAESFRDFLVNTKGFKGLKIEAYFPYLRLFYSSARHHISNKGSSGLTDRQIFRLRKIMSKVRKQL